MNTEKDKWLIFIEIILIIMAVVNFITSVEWIVVIELMRKPESVEEWLKYIALNEKWFNRGALSVIALGFYGVIRSIRYYSKSN